LVEAAAPVSASVMELVAWPRLAAEDELDFADSGWDFGLRKVKRS
jgi:hypothetical protein